MTTPAFVGIDVAIAKTKRLPVVVARWQDGALVPFELKRARIRPPRGFGNGGALCAHTVAEFARQARDYLHEVEDILGVRIERLAIDASKSPKVEGSARRACEVAMDRLGISVFTTPSAAEFREIIRQGRSHLAAGGAPSRLPHANQLWMLAGFELFRALESFSPLEVYPQAVVRTIAPGARHKGKTDGLAAQMAAVRRRTGWPSTRADLTNICFGSAHDKLDAYLCAWVAALDPSARVAHGTPPDDVIWTPPQSTIA